MVSKTFHLTTATNNGGGGEYHKAKRGKETIVAAISLIVILIAIIAVIVWMDQTGILRTPETANGAGEYQDTAMTLDAKASRLEAFMRADKMFEHDEQIPTVSVGNFTNWDSTVTRTGLLVVEPNSLRQVQRAVRAAIKAGLSVRAAGAGYSYTDLYAEEGQLVINSGQLTVRADGSDPIQLSDDAMGGMRTVRILAGVTMHELVEFSVAKGVQIPALPVLVNAQIGGAIATGSHGGKGVMGEHLVGVTLVDGTGQVQTIDSVMQPDAMHALRCCVGLCGIFYDLVFKVEPMQHVRNTHLWLPVRDVMVPDVILEYLSEGNVIGHWAPLTGWTDAEWTHYMSTGEVPQTYDPWDDIIWIKHSVFLPSTRRRRRNTHPRTEVEPLPVLLGGARVKRDSHSSAEDSAEVNETTQSPPTTTAPNTPPPTTAEPVDNNLYLHKYAYDMQLNLTAASNNSEKPLPEALASYNATDAYKILEVGMTLMDTSDLNRTQRFYNMLLESLRVSLVTNKQMPILTIVNRWLHLSDNCYLCPNHGDKDTYQYVFTASLTWNAGKPEFVSWFSKIFADLSAEFPDMRIRWAYADKEVTGLIEHMKTSLGDDLDSFLDIRDRYGFDPSNMFLNDVMRTFV